jgi:myo-inositol-1(or 4)-monophosphatase
MLSIFSRRIVLLWLLAFSAFLLTDTFGFNVQLIRKSHSFRLHASALDDEWRQLPADETLAAVLNTAKTAALAAGAIIRDNIGAPSHQIEEKTSIKDIVTVYDSQAQDVIERTVRAKHPDHSFLGEENVAPGSEASAAALISILKESDWVWIVDPIDGTANFASGLPLCGVCIAVAYMGTTVASVIYDPHRDELFSAIKGLGAYMNNEPIKTGTVLQVRDAVVNAGYPANPEALAASLRGMQALSKQARGIRLIACSALTTAWIACGRLTAHFGYDLSSWDLASGALLIQEAGGCVTGLDGSPYTLETRSMLCSNGHVHDEILNALKEADAVWSSDRTPTRRAPSL